MKESQKNIAASILARLRNQSNEMNRPFAEVLQYFGMERFLHRLSKTRYADKFILKGGLLFYVWNISLRRPTRDIDFRGYVSGNSQMLLKIIGEVIGVSAPEEAIEYPNILPDLETIPMKGYPKEAVVAEKFHAMIQHGDLNSRMKDYYDLWLMSKTFEFESKSLQKAIETTFKNRDTGLPVERPVSLSVEFASANNTRWNNFLEKMNIPTTESADFAYIIESVWTFIEHPLQASISQKPSSRKWTPQKDWG